MRRRINEQTKLEITRDNFLKMRGGKLISIEAYVLGAIVFFVLCIKNNWQNESMLVALFVAFIIGFVFPILVGLFQSIAWLAAVLFSLIWAFMACVITSAIVGGSMLVGLLVGAIFFAISFMAHKNYSGITFHGIRKKRDGQQVRDDQQAQAVSNESAYETVRFCPKCGRRITSMDGRCHVCDK